MERLSPFVQYSEFSKMLITGFGLVNQHLEEEAFCCFTATALIMRSFLVEKASPRQDDSATGLKVAAYHTICLN